MKKKCFAVSIVVLFVAGLFFAADVLASKTGDTKAIGSPANPTVQTGWWYDIPSKLGITHVDKADLQQIASQNIAQMKVVDPAILKKKGFSNIQAGAMVQVIRVKDNQAKIKLLPNGPEKLVIF